jgi:ABC-type sugar transport system ATPase subunit
MARALFGMNAPESGEIILEGRRISPRSTKEALELGIAYVPEGRQTEGIILRQDVESNITLSTIKKFANKFSLVNFKKRAKAALEWINRLGVRPGYPDMLAAKLSGGNQQKVVVAKWLASSPKVLIVDEPTNGIDVAAKREIHTLLRKLADDGMGIIMISSELPEVLAISDRILVMRQGRIVAEFDGGTATQEEIMNQAVTKSRISADNQNEKWGEAS